MKTLLFCCHSLQSAWWWRNKEPLEKTNNTSTEKIVTDKAVTIIISNWFQIIRPEPENLRQDLFTVVDNRQAPHNRDHAPRMQKVMWKLLKYMKLSNFERHCRRVSRRSVLFQVKAWPINTPHWSWVSLRRVFKPWFSEQISPMNSLSRILPIIPHTRCFKSQRNPGQLPWKCNTPEQQLSEGLNNQVSHAGLTSRSGGDLKTMRLAQSCNAEFQLFRGHQRLTGGAGSGRFQ